MRVRQLSDLRDFVGVLDRQNGVPWWETVAGKAATGRIWEVLLNQCPEVAAGLAQSPCDSRGRCEFSWSPNDSWLAIWYIYTESSPRFLAVWLLEVSTKSISGVRPTRPTAYMQEPFISPDSNLMVIPLWSNDTAIDIYSCDRREFIARIDDPGSWYEPPSAFATLSLSISADSTRFAIARRDGVRVYGMDGVCQSVLCPDPLIDSPPSQRWMHQHVIWSSDGSRIAFWRPANATRLLILTPADSTSLAIAPLNFDTSDETGAGLLWGPYGILPVLRAFKSSPTTSNRGVIRTMLIGHGTAYGQESAHLMGAVRVPIGYCMPVLSPDGSFIAALEPEGRSIQVFDAQSCACMMEHKVKINMKRARVHLAWTSSGRGLVVQAWHGSPPNSLAQEDLAVLRF